MRLSSVSFIVMSIVGLGVVVPVRADTTFSNLGAGDSYDCCTGWAVYGSAAPIELDRGSPFVPLNTYTLDSIEAALTWSSGPNAGDIWLMSDSGGEPGVILESFHIDNLPTFTASNTALAIGNSTLHPLLSAGVQYWLIASADGDSFLSLNWNITGDTGLASRDDNGPWGVGPDATAGAFRVNGTLAALAVPEPATLTLLGLAVAGMAWARRRKLH